jgi:hypothetical protein
MQRYRTRDLSPLVEQCVLLRRAPRTGRASSAGRSQIGSLTRVLSLTARMFMLEEQDQNHGHLGNSDPSLQVIADWTTERQRETAGGAAR